MINTPARIVALTIAALAAGPVAAQEVSLSAHLMGMAERPAAGDPDGMGHATVKVDLAKSQVCYTLMIEGIAPATMAHIHKAPADAAGPVAVPLAKPDAAGKAAGCATVAPDVAKDIAANPAGYYVNVHNAEFGAGAIRGQLSK
jgi:hypothetical protein